MLAVSIRVTSCTLALWALSAGAVLAQTPAAAPPATATAADIELEKTAIRKTIIEAYVEGMFLKADPEAVRRGWHPGCDIVVLQRGTLVKMPAYNFARRFDRERVPLDPNAKAEFLSITVSGYAAVAVLELKSGDRPVYTDMLSLYKFDDGWKIVTKVFYEYPRPAR
jgi:hypothetical protein